MSGLTKTLTAVQKGNEQKRSIEPLSTCYQGNKYYYDHGHLTTLSLTGCLCGRNATAEVSPLTLAGLVHHEPCPTRNSRHWLIPCLPELTHSRKVNHTTGVRSWCHSFCPITSMQSNNISAPLWSYSLLFHIHHCQLLYSHSQIHASSIFKQQAGEGY